MVIARLHPSAAPRAAVLASAGAPCASRRLCRFAANGRIAGLEFLCGGAARYEYGGGRSVCHSFCAAAVGKAAMQVDDDEALAAACGGRGPIRGWELA